MKSDKRGQGPGIIIARYGSTYALVHFRGAYLEVSLDDMKSTDRILDVLGRDGTLQLHLANTKFPLRYLVGSQTLIFLSKARNEILKRNPITWTTTDTRLSVRDFYENDLNQQIAINELGGQAFRDFLDHIGAAGELRNEEGAQESISELKTLMRGQRIDRNSSNLMKLSGNLGERITKTLLYGKKGKSPIDLKVGKIKRALLDFAKLVKDEKNWKYKQYQEKEKEDSGESEGRSNEK